MAMDGQPRDYPAIPWSLELGHVPSAPPVPFAKPSRPGKDWIRKRPPTAVRPPVRPWGHGAMAMGKWLWWAMAITCTSHAHHSKQMMNKMNKCSKMTEENIVCICMLIQVYSFETNEFLGMRLQANIRSHVTTSHQRLAPRHAASKAFPLIVSTWGIVSEGGWRISGFPSNFGCSRLFTRLFKPFQAKTPLCSFPLPSRRVGCWKSIGMPGCFGGSNGFAGTKLQPQLQQRQVKSHDIRLTGISWICLNMMSSPVPKMLFTDFRQNLHPNGGLSTFSQALEAALKETTLGWQPKTRLAKRQQPLLPKATYANINFSLLHQGFWTAITNTINHNIPQSTIVKLAWKSKPNFRINEMGQAMLRMFCSVYSAEFAVSWHLNTGITWYHGLWMMCDVLTQLTQDLICMVRVTAHSQVLPFSCALMTAFSSVLTKRKSPSSSVEFRSVPGVLTLAPWRFGYLMIFGWYLNILW